MFSFINKKTTGVWSSEVHCSKSMEKSEAIQKIYMYTPVEWKYKILNFH